MATPVAAVPVSEIVADAGSGKTVIAFQTMRVRPPESLTKMMTLLLIFETISSGRPRTDVPCGNLEP